MKNLAITTVTHGNEAFSIPIVKKLSARYGFAWFKNNPRALKLEKRFFQQDLNRSGPGNLNSPKYEGRLAYRLIKKYSRYKTVIDIHGSLANCGIFALISDLNYQNIELAKKLDVKNIVLWPSMRSYNAALTQFIPNSLELECGPKDNPKTALQLEKTLTAFLNNIPVKRKQNFYIVTGILRGNIKAKMYEFSETKYRKRYFIPLLIDRYPGIKCYMMQKISYTLAE